MRVIGIDGGAERLGWAIVEREEDAFTYLDSGLVRMPRKAVAFQEYRVNYITSYVQALAKHGSILDQEIYPVDALVNETVPAVGSFGGTQMYLVNVGVTVIQTLAIERDIPVYQISAPSVHTRIVGKKVKGKKTSKAQVRNGVIRAFPHLAPRKKEWTGVWDEPDAIAVALAYLGYKNQG